jgi:RecA/RadA recombinase
MPVSAEQAGAIARHFLVSGALDLVVIDSAAAMVPELRAEPWSDRALQSRVLGSELHKLAASAAGAEPLY